MTRADSRAGGRVAASLGRRRLRVRLACGLALPLAAGCTVGPNFEAPRPPATASAPFATKDATTISAAEPPDGWWELYGDPDIDRVVREALRSNTDLLAAIARLERAQGVLSEARAGLLPATLLSGGARVRQGVITGPGITELQGSGAVGGSSSSNTSGSRVIYAAGADVAYDLDLFGRIRRDIQAARADAQAQAAAADYVRVAVAAETTRAFVGACTSAQRIAVAQDGLRVADAAYVLAERQTRLGTEDGFNLTRFGALREQAAAAIPPLENERRADLFNLALLTGHTPAQVDPAAAACKKAPQLSQPLPAGDGASLIARRPDIREADRKLAAETARIGVETAALFPQVVLGASAVSAGPGLNYAVSQRGVAFALGPVISWTFPNVQVARARIAQARASTREAYASYQGTVLGALNETERALTAYLTEAQRNLELRKAVGHQRQAFSISAAGARLGATTPIDLLDTDRTLVQVENDLSQSDSLLLDRGVSVFKSLGGGWRQGSGSAARRGAPNVTSAPVLRRSQ